MIVVTIITLIAVGLGIYQGVTTPFFGISDVILLCNFISCIILGIKGLRADD